MAQEGGPHHESSEVQQLAEPEPLFAISQREAALESLLHHQASTESIQITDEPARRVRKRDVKEFQARVIRAAWFVEDVIHREVQLRPLVLGSHRGDLTIAYLQRYIFKHLATASLLALIVISLFERPRWTYANNHWRFYPMWFAPELYLTPFWANLTQGALLAVLTPCLAAKLYLLRHGLLSKAEPLELRLPLYIETIAFLGLLIEYICIVSLPGYGEGTKVGNIFQITMLCVRHPPIYNTWRLVFNLVPKILNVVVLLVLFMVFSSWVFWWIFIVAPPGASMNIFDTIDTSYYHLMEFLTKNNFPDLMMPFMDENSLSSMIFFAFIFVAVFILLNMVIGVVFWHYQRQNSKLQKTLNAMNQRNIETAFGLLDATGSRALGVEEVVLLLERMDLYRRLGALQGERVQQVLYRLAPPPPTGGGGSDESGSDDAGARGGGGGVREEFIDLEEFAGIVEVLGAEFREVGPQSPLEVHAPGMYRSPAIQWVVAFARDPPRQPHHPAAAAEGEGSPPGLEGFSGGARKRPWGAGGLTVAVDVVILGQLALLTTAVIDSATQAHAYFYKVVEDVFISVYFAELCLRLLVVGPAYHLRSLGNRMDSLLILAVFVSMNLEIINNKYLHVFNFGSLEGIRVMQALSALRTVKLFRHLRMAPNFLTLMACLDAVLDSASTLVLTLLSFIYLSASIGVAIWGGSVCRAVVTKQGFVVCHNNAGIPATSAFVEHDYFGNNFNDIFSAMTLVFEIFYGGNIWDLCSGLAAATGDVAGMRTFFVLNWGFGVNILLNIVLSVVINSTLEEYGKKHLDEVPSGRAKMSERIRKAAKSVRTVMFIGRRGRSRAPTEVQTTLAQDLAHELNMSPLPEPTGVIGTPVPGEQDHAAVITSNH